jgi:hypothetical protein
MDAGAPGVLPAIAMVRPVDLEEQSLDPVIERTCAECGARLTEPEIRASLESGGPYLCSVHASEDVPVGDEDEPAQ